VIALDTNVLVRYLVQDDPQQSRRATKIVEAATASDPRFLATIVWIEAYWVLTRAYHASKTDVLAWFGDLLNAEEVEAEDYHSVAHALVAAQQGADFADALIDQAARRAGCSATVTFDERASKRLGWQLI
jgi:predicted nucleic-acid-binding protein